MEVSHFPIFHFPMKDCLQIWGKLAHRYDQASVSTCLFTTISKKTGVEGWLKEIYFPQKEIASIIKKFKNHT